MRVGFILIGFTAVLVLLTVLHDWRAHRRLRRPSNIPGRCYCGAFVLNGSPHVSTYLVRHEPLRCQPAREVIL